MLVDFNLLRKALTLAILAATCCQLMISTASGQRARFGDTPDFYQVQTSQPATFQGGVQGPFGQSPPPNLTLNPPPSTILPPGTVINPNTSPIVTGPPFDPYNLNTSPLPTLPSRSSGFYGQGTPTYQNSAPPSMSFGNNFNPPPVMQPNVGDGYVFGQNSAPWSMGNNGPNGGNRASNNPSAWPGQQWSNNGKGFWPRLIEHPRWRHTWISGNNGNEMSLNESEIATTLTVPNFAWSNQPLMVSPGFFFSFWDGPDTAMTGFDMPAVTYAPYLTVDTMSDDRRNAGLEGSLTVGVYSDFRNVTSDSLRVTGTGLGWFKINPTTTFKLGVEYYDRINVKMLPAFGFFMKPNNDMKVDLYFPRPRLSHRLPKLGNVEIWGYVGAEYGGGSWTIERMGGMDDQVDVNDVRAFMGYEWVGPRGVTGFVEGGYVFQREMLYRSNPLNQLDLQDAIMVRGGFAF
jgi:hypothetical protein